MDQSQGSQVKHDSQKADTGRAKTQTNDAALQKHLERSRADLPIDPEFQTGSPNAPRSIGQIDKRLDMDSESEAKTLVVAGFLNPDESGWSSQEESPSKRRFSNAISEERQNNKSPKLSLYSKAS